MKKLKLTEMFNKTKKNIRSASWGCLIIFLFKFIWGFVEDKIFSFFTREKYDYGILLVFLVF